MRESQRSRTEVRRVPGRGKYTRAEIDPILDAGMVAHVGIAQGEQPFVIPMVYARDGDALILHGSRASRLMRALADGVAVCATITLVDGLVLARSAFHHSVNYRSVVVLGRATPIEDPAERDRCFNVLIEHVAPGRSSEIRMPNAAEDQQTMMVSLPLDECSAKVRTGPPVDDEADYALPIWAGVLPISNAPGAPEPDPKLRAGVELPAHLSPWTRPA